jgi:hypothetical protein
MHKMPKAVQQAFLLCRYQVQNERRKTIDRIRCRGWNAGLVEDVGLEDGPP